MIIVFIVFVVLLFIGVPVGFSVLAAGVCFFFQHPELPLTTVPQLPVTQLQNVTLLAVPLFIFAGNLMNASGITQRLIKLSMALTGHMRGGMAQVSVVLSTLMGGVSGSANADAAMEARILGPDMLEQGYPKGYTSCVIAFTALITATIPPGVGLITYGTTGNVSIGKLFAAGITVGLIMMVMYMLLVAVTARIYDFKPIREEKASLKEIMGILKECIWAVIFPILLLVGIRLGLFTPSEVGSFACVYAIFVGKFVYKEMTKEVWIQTLKNSIVDIGSIMFMISMSGAFGYGIPIDKLPQKVTVLITGLTNSPLIVMAMVVLFLVIAGMFMEGSIIILLTTPILLPLTQSYGIDPVVFGMIMCTIVTMGNMTPPVGMAMYTVCGILKCKLEDYIKACPPFIILVLVEVFILTLFPSLVMFLPNLMYR